MQLEQLSIDYDVPLQIIYNQLDNDGKVYSKIDWLTVMFYDASLNDVLKWLRLDGAVTDFCAGAYQQSRGYDEVFKFLYNNILLETASFNYYGQTSMNVSLFDMVVPKIRVELSGKGLDFLRSIGVNMDTYRFVVPECCSSGSTYHFTRCDFAFDFVNYHADFVDRVISHCHDHMLPSGRVPLSSTKGAVSCKLVTGGQKTVYLGSPQSDSMLRIYDKRMQQIDLESNVYKVSNPYRDPDSWFRIEWQCRNKLANNLVQDSSIDFKHILRLIFERYSFADGMQDARATARRPVEFWLSLFNWAELELRIIQNANFVEYESPSQRVIKSFESVMIRTFIFWYSLLGREAALKRLQDYLRSLEGDDPVSRRRYVAFLNRLNELDDFDLPDADSVAGGLCNLHGRLHFKW